MSDDLVGRIDQLTRCGGCGEVASQEALVLYGVCDGCASEPGDTTSAVGTARVTYDDTASTAAPTSTCSKHGAISMVREPHNDDMYCEACEGEVLANTMLGRFAALGAAGEVLVGMCINEVSKAFAHAEKLVRMAAAWLRGRWHR